MHTRKEVDLCIQRTDFIDLTTVRTNLVFRDQAAHFSVFHLFQDFSHIPHDTVKFFVVCIFFFVSSNDLVFHCLSRRFTRQFFFYLNSLLEVAVVGCDDFSLQFSIYMKQFYFCFFFTDCRNDFFLEGNQFFNSFVPFQKGFQHDFFRQFFGTRLYHVNSVLGTSHCQFKKRALSLFLRWVDDDFPVNITYLYSSDWSVKRNI